MDGLAWVRRDPPDLSWLGHPGGHSFRWRDADGRWWTAPRRVPTGERLVAELRRRPPRDVYVGTARWLEPVALPRLRDADRAPPVLLDHLIVFDLDRAPFSLARLEHARADAARLVDWLRQEARVELVHVAFSGSKGFHVVARDPDRAPFAEPEPRAREMRVRAARAQLLQRALDAGHDVDKTVTADTRRVVRLPGTLHGETGWACSIVPLDALARPLEEWVDALPRAPGAKPMPREAPAPAPRAPRRAPAPAAESYLQLQASSHVVGTRDRGALLAWVASTRRLDDALRDAGVGPALLWRHGARTLVLVPRALPRPALARAARALGLAGFATALAARGHAWVAVAPASDEDGALEPAGALAGGACAHPWSRPHLDLARRLGQPHEPEGAQCGGERAQVRLAQLR